MEKVELKHINGPYQICIEYAPMRDPGSVGARWSLSTQVLSTAHQINSGIRSMPFSTRKRKVISR
jgi:hypothetical protein